MKRSTERFLTTHTGSLPRPDDLIRMMYAKEEGVPVERCGAGGAGAHSGRRGGQKAGRRRRRPDQRRRTVEAELRHLHQGPAQRLRRHRQHVRLSGSRRVSRSSRKRCSAIPAARGARRPACNAPISVRDPQAARTDVDNLKAALSQVKAPEGFMSAASPGVVSLFFRNDHYKDFETYIYAIADAMRDEYETVAKAGFVLQIDCPDLGMGRHIQYADLDLEGVPQAHPAAHRGAQPCHREHPARAAAACICAGAITRARTTATCRSPTSSTSCSRRGRRRSRSRPPIRATPTNTPCSKP